MTPILQRIPVRHYHIHPARPIPAGDQRILDDLSRQRLLVVNMWHIAGYAEVKLPKRETA